MWQLDVQKQLDGFTPTGHPKHRCDPWKHNPSFTHRWCSRSPAVGSANRSSGTAPRRIWDHTRRRGSRPEVQCTQWPAGACRFWRGASHRGRWVHGTWARQRLRWCWASSSSRGCWRHGGDGGVQGVAGSCLVQLPLSPPPEQGGTQGMAKGRTGLPEWSSPVGGCPAESWDLPGPRGEILECSLPAQSCKKVLPSSAPKQANRNIYNFRLNWLSGKWDPNFINNHTSPQNVSEVGETWLCLRRRLSPRFPQLQIQVGVMI